MRRFTRLAIVFCFALPPAATLFVACSDAPVVVTRLPDTDAGKPDDPDARDAADAANDAADATSDASDGADGADDAADAKGDEGIPVEAGVGPLCSLPGSVQYANGKVTVVPGGTAPDASYLTLPDGFCAHYFGNVGNARQVRVAPGGEVFIASPTTGTTGGNSQAGKASIVVLPDDDHDGVADQTITFLENLPSTQGIMFANDHFYYQDHAKIMRVPYASGNRAPSGPAEQVTEITALQSSLHWPKPIDIADDGTIYVGNGGDQSDPCNPAGPFRGGILKLDGTPGGTQVSRGYRNPIAIRCQRGHNRCYAIELALDYSGNNNTGGREKMVPIREGDDWGFPCCATKDIPYPQINPVPDCSGVALDTDSFLIGDTPFGVDFEPGLWPAPYKNAAFVAMHGTAGTWVGARVLTIGVDPATGEVLPGENLVFTTGETGAMADFATGWAQQLHGRPAAVTFGPDGRLYLTNDTNGDILWIAPLGF